MKRHGIILCLLMTALTGCSHKTLIVPCDGNVGPIGSVATPLGPNLNVTPTAAAPTDCGPLKPVNLQPVSE